MTDYSHLKALDVQADKTIPYSLDQIEGAPTLMLKPATEANKPFYNTLLKRAKTSQKKRGVNADTVTAYRNEDRELYAKYVITDWKNMKDSKGNEVAFSKEECLAFLTALPNYIFDEVREFASKELNFVEDSIDVEATAKN